MTSGGQDVKPGWLGEEGEGEGHLPSELLGRVQGEASPRKHGMFTGTCQEGEYVKQCCQRGEQPYHDANLIWCEAKGRIY